MKIRHEDCFQTQSGLIVEYFKGDDILHVDAYTSKKKKTNNEKNENNLYLGYESIKRFSLTAFVPNCLSLLCFRQSVV